MDKNIILEKTYAGFLGMNVGIRLGAPVEPSLWTYERINRFYGEITGYVKSFINFAADDDVNGPVYFLKSLEDNIQEDKGMDFVLKPEHVARTWLNYTREGVGFFWWGGYGTSTEHTAYLNLKNGLPAPRSGSMEVNGKTLAEQIGGQIFIDTWGFINPGHAQRAAAMARTAASVSHDGDGLNGAAFIAAAISLSYEDNDVESVIRKALEFVDPSSLYKKVVESVMAFHEAHPQSWRDCMTYLIENWGYDKYPGVCHIIPNAGVCIMAMVYGRDFKKAIEIATMAGWDTDCNAGNVGSIMGVMCGIDSIGEAYRLPINDFIALSGISGYLNILDVPTYAKKLYHLGQILNGQESEGPRDGVIDFDFSLKDSTSGMRTSDPNLLRISNPNDQDGLRVVYDRMVRPQKAKVFYKTFYRRFDFSDERYMPVFSPLAYSGQSVSVELSVKKINGESIIIQSYVRDTSTQKDILIDQPRIIWEDTDLKLEFTIPDTLGSYVDEVGFIVESNSPAKFRDLGEIRVHRFSIMGNMDYTIDPRKLKMEFASVLGFSHDKGSWSINGDKIELMCLEPSLGLTGNYYGRDELIRTTTCLHYGSSALIGLRVQGAMRGYWGGIENGKLTIDIMEDGKLRCLAQKPMDLCLEKNYELEFQVEGDNLELKMGDDILKVRDDSLSYGMVGLMAQGPVRLSYSNIAIKQTL